MHLSISNDIVSANIYDKRDDFEIVNFQFLDGDAPRSTSYGVYISQLIRFARASSHVADFNTRNKLLTQKLLKQGYRYHKLHRYVLKRVSFGSKDCTRELKLECTYFLGQASHFFAFPQLV